MRITNNMMINNLLVSLQRNMNAVSKSQEMMASGKRFILPSDDPIGMAKSLRLNSDLSDNEQYKKNCSSAVSWIDMTEDVISNIQSALSRASQLAVQAANDPYTEDETEKIGEELKQLRKEVISDANGTYAGRYLFSGFKTDCKLLNDDGSYNIAVGKTASAEFNNDTDALPAGVKDLEVEVSNDGVTRKVIRIPMGSSAATAKLIRYNSDGTETSLGSSATTDTSTWGKLRDTINNLTINDTVTDPLKPVMYSLNPKAIPAGTANFSSAGVTADIIKNTADSASKSKLVINVNSNLIKEVDNTVSPAATVNKLGLTAQPEDINYGVSVAESLKVNVLGTDLFGNGVAGETPALIKVFDDFISALTVKAKPLDDAVANCKTVSGVNTGVNELETALKNLKDSHGIPMIDADTITKIKNALTPVPIDDNMKAQAKTLVDDAIAKYRTKGFQSAISNLSMQGDVASKVRAKVGAISNRADLTLNRLEDNKTNFTKLLTDNEEIDLEEIIMQITSQQSVYQASLSVGAKVIQPSLVDFIK